MSVHPDRPLTDRLQSVHRPEFVWDTRGPTAVHAHVTKTIVSQLNHSNAHSVLDLGCGNGWFAGALERCGFEVTGVDHSESGIAIASQQHPEVEFIRHDLTLPLRGHLVGRFDAVVSIEVIEHLLLPRRLIENALTALKPGGLLVVSAPFHGYLKNLALALAGKFDEHWHPLRDYGHVKFFSKATLTALLVEYGLEHLRFETTGRVPTFARSMVISGRSPR
jgi:2-polyprenyl-3-methyl-5-hydroxy-6-metoxy-1,4-benzoquinol methylase